MAATDTTYRSTKILHIVFAVTSILMLITIAGMFADDYYRDWKVEQRIFRDVEEEMAKRGVLAAAPTGESVQEISAVETDLLNKKSALAQVKTDFEKQQTALLSRKIKKETELAAVKADHDSIMSFINLETEKYDKGLDAEKVKKLRKRLTDIDKKMVEVSAEVEKNQTEYDEAAQKAGIPDMEKAVAEAEKKYKEMLADFDRFIKLSMQKRWSWKDTFRALPIIDSFASPTKIQQYTLTDLPIDYSFKYVTRYDRCTTCHMGLEKAAFDKATLAGLTEDPGLNKELANRYAGAKAILKEAPGRWRARLAEVGRHSPANDRQIAAYRWPRRAVLRSSSA